MVTTYFEMEKIGNIANVVGAYDYGVDRSLVETITRRYNPQQRIQSRPEWRDLLEILSNSDTDEHG